MSVLLLLLACQGAPTPGSGAGEDTGSAVVRTPLEAPRLARRLSLDLRGVLPTAAELDAVEADADALADLRREWLADPRFEDRMVALLAESWHTRVDAFDIRYYDYGLDPTEEHAFERAVGEEPLRLMARVAAEDLPWSTIVTADWTMGDELLAELWPLACEEGEGWRRCTWTDGRPAAGVLASNGLWWRYSTSMFNLSRTRAAAASRLLACEDIAARPVSFSASPALLDAEGTELAVATEPACLSCHAAVDPLAATFFGFFPAERFSVFEMTTYHPERERSGPDALGTEMAWFGTPVEGLAHLGLVVAADPRFSSCAVETMASALWRRPVDAGDRAALTELRETFEAEDLRMKALITAITDGERYRVGELGGEGGGEPVGDRAERLLPPEVVGAVLSELTGFSWEDSGFDLLANDEVGYRVLAGGVDGVYVLSPQGEPGLTWLATHRRLAEAAAATAVQAAFSGGPGEARLLGGVTLDDRPGDPAFDDRLADLHWELLAVRATADDVAEVTSLWTEVEAVDGDAAAAWQAVLTLLFLDPRFLSA